MLIIAVVYLTLTSSPPEVFNFELGDKIGHLIAYSTLMAWFGQLYLVIRTQFKFAISFCVMGALLEVVQGMGGVRFFDYFDMLANAVGVGLGWWLTRGVFAGMLTRIELLIVRIAK